MCSFMNLQILASREHFSASRKRTRKRFLSCVDSDMVDKFVFGFERASIPGTLLPVTGVVRLLGPTDMVNC